jgi:hypothetical protein
MYRAKTGVLRAIVVLFISIGCLVLSGCLRGLHGLTHPHSDVTAPTFCLYEGWKDGWEAERALPVPIYLIRVTRAEKFSGDERFEWCYWHSWRKGRDSDEVTWEMEYMPDDKAHPLARPFACITYGKVPPGYIETIPTQPLMSERVYTVRLQSERGKPMSWVYFIIRADSTGHLTQLEASHDGPYDIRVINRE